MNLDTLMTLFKTISMVDYLVLTVNVLLIIFARPVLKRFAASSLTPKTLNVRVNLLRGLNVIIIFVYGYQYLYAHATQSNGTIVKILSILAILYMANLSNFLVQYVIHKQYGKAREIDNKMLYIETYQSRLLSILAAIFISVLTIVLVVHQLGVKSLLEAGGVLGIIGVFLGLTQSSWAPDIISGLIILNSDMFEEGDIIETDCGVLGRVHKTKLFHTEILNIGNNHRIMIRNAHMRDKTIHNLSQFATAKGLRECLSFKIGYDVKGDAVKAMLTDAFEQALEAKIPLESNTAPKIKVLDTGDHAVCWGILFHIKQVDQILNIRRDFREIILDASISAGISLATPITHQATIEQESKPS